MASRNILIGVLLLAAAVVFIAPGFFGTSSDNKVDYIPTLPTAVEYGQPIAIDVTMIAKQGDPNRESGSWFDNCQNAWDTSKGAPYSTWCSTFTYFNARSFRISVDGQQVVNTHDYPANKGRIAFTTPFIDEGPVVCYNTCGQPCSNAQNLIPAYRAYYFSQFHPAGNPVPYGNAAFNNTRMLLLNIPQYLKPGLHNVEVIYFAETVGMNVNDNTCTVQYGASLNGNSGSGDLNSRQTVGYAFQINVLNNTGQLPCAGTVDANGLCNTPRPISRPDVYDTCAMGEFTNPNGCSYFVSSNYFYNTSTSLPVQPSLPPVNYTSPPPVPNITIVPNGTSSASPPPAPIPIGGGGGCAACQLPNGTFVCAPNAACVSPQPILIGQPPAPVQDNTLLTAVIIAAAGYWLFVRKKK